MELLRTLRSNAAPSLRGLATLRSHGEPFVASPHPNELGRTLAEYVILPLIYAAPHQRYAATLLNYVAHLLSYVAPLLSYPASLLNYATPF
jgi:hypothetical protein